MTEKPTKNEEAAEPTGGTRKWLIIGCLVFVVLPTVCCLSFVIYGYFYGNEIAFNAMREPVLASFKNSPLSQADQDKLIVQVDRVGAAWFRGKLTHNEVREIMEELTATSTLTLAKLQGIQQIANESHLDQSDKSAINRTIGRVGSGLSTGEIKKLNVDAALDSATQSEDFRKLAASLSEEELLKIHAALKTLADNAEVADEDFTIEIDAEIKHVVDRHLKVED